MSCGPTECSGRHPPGCTRAGVERRPVLWMALEWNSHARVPLAGWFVSALTTAAEHSHVRLWAPMENVFWVTHTPPTWLLPSCLASFFLGSGRRVRTVTRAGEQLQGHEARVLLVAWLRQHQRLPYPKSYLLRRPEG